MEKVKTEQEKAAVEQEKAAVEQEKAAVEQEKAAVEQEKAAVEQEKAAVAEEKASLQKEELSALDSGTRQMAFEIGIEWKLNPEEMEGKSTKEIVGLLEAKLIIDDKLLEKYPETKELFDFVKEEVASAETPAAGIATTTHTPGDQTLSNENVEKNTSATDEIHLSEEQRESRGTVTQVTESPRVAEAKASYNSEKDSNKSIEGLPEDARTVLDSIKKETTKDNVTPPSSPTQPPHPGKDKPGMGR
jgi:hypothetical protein